MPATETPQSPSRQARPARLPCVFGSPGRTPTREDALAMLAEHHRALEAGGDAVLKNHRRTAVTRILHNGELLCVKEYKCLGWLDRVKDALRRPRANRAWQGALRLEAHGVTTPQAVAVIEQAARRYLVTRYIEGAAPLNRLLDERSAGPAAAAAELNAQRAMIRELARWLRRVHDLGIYHDDWSAKNILVAQDEAGWHFYLLDYESVSPHARLTPRRRAKNLGQLSDIPVGVSRADKMRFLLAYAGEDRSLTRGRFVQAIVDFARRRAERRQRRVQRSRSSSLDPEPRTPNTDHP